MYGVFVVSQIDPARAEEAVVLLKGGLAPRVSGAPGFIRGTWARSDETGEGRSLVLFETEEQAHGMIALLADIPPDGPVQVRSTTVLEVIHQLEA